MKYKVTETYTPDDVDCDRRRVTATFETESTGLLEIAELAFAALLGMSWPIRTNEERLEIAKKRLAEDNIEDQLADILDDETGDLEGFTYNLFSNNGEYDYAIELTDD